MQLIHALAFLLPALTLAADENQPCSVNGQWDCGGDANANHFTTILQCSYQHAGTSSLTWTRIATCDNQTPCCDHRAVQMGAVPHCNARPSNDPVGWCGRGY